MIRSLIVAYDSNRAIGKDNDLLWRLPSDMQHFKSTTMGHFVIMGRKTYESIGKPLPGRLNIILSRNNDYYVEGAIVMNDLEGALFFAKLHGQKEVFIIGGGSIYEEALKKDLVDRIYLTEVHYSFADADAHLPRLDQYGWIETTLRTVRRVEKDDISKIGASDYNQYAHTFIVLEKER